MGAGILDTLTEAISGLAAVDVDALCDGELDALTIGLQRERHRLEAVAATLNARWEARGVWANDRSRSSAARLSRDAGISHATARRELRRARALTDMPATADAVAAGRISMDHVDLLAAADTTERHDAFTRDETMLVEHCATLRYPQAAKVIDYWKLRVDATHNDDTAAEPHDRAQLHASATFEGTVRIDGHLDPIGGAIFLTELDRLTRQLELTDRHTATVRSAAQRRAAALVEMATRSAAMPKGSRRPKPLFTVVIGDQRFTELCELATGLILTPHHLLPHLTTADMETILFDGITALGVSNRRTFTGRIRRAIEVRDRHCQHPSGCDTPTTHCDVDHIQPTSHGGTTSQFNGRLECRPHNRDTTKHDHHAQPLPHRDINHHDLTAARRHWRRKRLAPTWQRWRLEPITDDPDEPDPPQRTDAA